jgi:NaMN:DMB phosphoribosyltransferase
VTLERRFVGSLATATAALGILIGIHAIKTERLLAGYAVAVAALALLAMVRSFRPEQTRRFEQALRGRKPAASQALELMRMERELLLGSADADHAHRRLLPLLRAAAAARLIARHGVELGRRPEAARALLGADVWELLRPDRPEPEDRHGPGVPREQIIAAIEAVEAL